MEIKEKYADPDELVKILQSQPKHEGALGFMEMMIAGIGPITYFYPDMFYAIRSRRKFYILSEREYSVIKNMSILFVIAGFILLILHMIG